MSSYAVEAASALAEKIDTGQFVPSRELVESVSELNAALARYARKTGSKLKLVNVRTDKS